MYDDVLGLTPYKCRYTVYSELCARVAYAYGPVAAGVNPRPPARTYVYAF